MTTEEWGKQIRPMNVQVKRNSRAEKFYRSQAGLPGDGALTEAIAPGLQPSPQHDLIFHGGKIVPRMTYTNFFVGGTQSWRQSDIDNIDRALAAAMQDARLNNVIAQYFMGAQISCTFRPSRILQVPRPALVSQGDIEDFVRRLHSQGAMDGFDLGTTIFNFMLPSGTVLNTNLTLTGNLAQTATDAGELNNPMQPHDDASSLNGLGGYHGSVHVSQPNGSRATVYYSVGVFSEIRADGRENGIVVFDESWKNVVATFYHELNEFRTDPDVGDAIRAGNSPQAEQFLGWVSQQGEEIGDFPIFESDPLTLVFREVQLTNEEASVPVQFQYSNAAHGPEGPIETAHNL